MNYFKENYDSIKYPIADENKKGLRNAQLGAIQAINSHFTLHEKEPAIIVMPTGSGKTAVLYLSMFTQRAKKVLIITPSKLVRNQIAIGMSSLAVLKNNGIVAEQISLPKVFEVINTINSLEEWNKLVEYDVVVATPNAIVPDSENFTPPEDIFDLILIDEAHHSPAHTWDLILKAFKKSKKVLFTATPFRRDQKEIKGKIIYNYPISKAYEDKIFGEVEFIAVSTHLDESNDIAIAKKTFEIFQNDRTAGFEHYIMVRTNTKKHAKELVKIYEDNTGLKLKRIDSTMTSRSIESALKQLVDKQIDGVICVDMLGEGFDFPNLKIAAIHNPHKSLAITLQFIGRFARTNTQNIGAAKFIAIPNEVEFYKIELYQEGAVWKDIIKEISENAIETEVEIKETLSKFESKDIELEDDFDLSLYSLKPYSHVKIFETNNVSIDISTELLIPGNEIEKHFVSEELSTSVFVTKEISKPRWMINDDLVDVKYNLFIVYYDAKNSLLFINASRKTIDTYNQIATQLLGEKPKKLPLSDVHKVLLDFNDTEVFNLGLRNKNSFSNSESYIIKSGSHVQNSIKSTEIVSYEGGHAFMRGKEDGSAEYKTIGYSSSSKVWSNTSSKITDFIKWCKILSDKVSSNRLVKTNTDLDKISIKEVFDTIPEGIVYASWHSKCIKNDLQYRYRKDGIEYTSSLADLEIDVIDDDTNTDMITYVISNDSFEEEFNFTLDDFHERENKDESTFNIIDSNGEEVEIEDAINNEYPISFYLKDFSSIVLNEISKSSSTGVNFDASKIKTIDWSDTDIDCEFEGSSIGRLNIHEKLKQNLTAIAPNALFYDHGTGETADFVMFRETDQNILIDLFHCKGAGGKMTGNRVADVYEVCGQSIKSCYYASAKELKQKIYNRINRANPSSFVFGDYPEIERLLNTLKMPKFNIVAVQPGITKGDLHANISEVLAAAESYIDKGDNVKFEVLASV